MFVPKAQVSVLPVEFAERNVYIFGNVKTSGSFKIPPMGNLSIVQLVSLAGGFTEDADRRNIILIREDQVGVRTTYKIPFIAVEKLGNVDLDVLRGKCNERVVGLMLTNPSTLGVFEKTIADIQKIVHDAGGLLYYEYLYPPTPPIQVEPNVLLGVAVSNGYGFKFY